MTRAPCAKLLASTCLLSLAVLLAVAAQPGPARGGSGAADAQAVDLVRLLNGERAGQGFGPLRVDPFLASKARDGAIACPDDATKVMAGRAADLAMNGGWNPNDPHALRLCPTVSVLDVMRAAWGYAGGVGEDLVMNSGYGTGQYEYVYGCQGAACPAPTYTFATTGHAAHSLMNSSYHRAIVLGSYDRVGCGAWISPEGAYYYSCLFSSGGPNPTIAPPTTSPFGTPPPTPTARPTAQPVPTTRPTPPPTPTRTATPPPAATIAPSAVRASAVVPETASPASAVEAVTHGTESADRAGSSTPTGASDETSADLERSSAGDVFVPAMGLAGLVTAGLILVSAALLRGRRSGR